MKHFKQTEGCGPDREQGGIQFEKIFSLCKDKGKIVITEACDAYFDERLSPSDAIELFEEAINWIKEN